MDGAEEETLLDTTHVADGCAIAVVETAKIRIGKMPNERLRKFWRLIVRGLK
jgi:hypothetical protein